MMWSYDEMWGVEGMLSLAESKQGHMHWKSLSARGSEQMRGTEGGSSGGVKCAYVCECASHFKGIDSGWGNFIYPEKQKQTSNVIG